MKTILCRFVFLLGSLFYHICPCSQENVLTRLRRKMYIGFISNRFASFGNNSDITSPITILGGKYIRIGKSSSIGKNGVITAWDRYGSDRFNPQIEIGDEVNIGQYCHITAINKVEIGNGVLTGRWVTITDNSHGRTDINSLELAPTKRNLCSAGPVIIEDNVWIGDKVTILPNVHIGRNAIIGANAVVTRDVPENAVVVGIPAKTVKIIN